MIPARLTRAADALPSRLGVSLAAAVMALIDVVSANILVPFPGVVARVEHAVWDLVLLFALGLGSDLVIHGALSLRRAWLRWLALFAVGTLAMWWLVDRIFVRQADALLDGRFAKPLYALFILSSGAGITLCVFLGRLIAKHPKWYYRGPAVIASLAAGVINQLVFRDDYIELHTVAVWCGATLLGSVIGPSFARFVEPKPEPFRRRISLACVLVVLIALVPPSNRARLSLFRSPGGVGAWLFANVVWQVPSARLPHGDLVAAHWLAPRTEGDRAPSSSVVARAPSVVILITIDATRADAVLDPANEARFPNLSRMRREGVAFTQARSAGSQTAVSLTAMFAGKYFSEMRWGKVGKGATRFEYASMDETPRFPALLDAGQVKTFKVASLTFLRNEFGVAPGFAEEKVVTSGRRHARGSEVTEPLLARIRNTKKSDALFAYAHLTEPHSPYDRGKLKQGPLWERYLSEITLADEYIGRVMQALSTSQLRDRAILIVSSDHGEAFGEHGTFEHTKTIYDEMLRVPLLVWGAGVTSREISTPVTLLDVGPTVLDVFGLPTPDWMAGESLVPLLAGQDVALTRPILAEGRLRRALFVGDLKAIVDLRRKTVEVFDLANDPGELRNLWDEDRARAEPVVSALTAYFAGRAYTKDGYRPLYKP